MSDLSANEKIQLEDRLTKIVQRLPDSPEQAATTYNTVLRSQNLHPTNVRVVIVEVETESERRWREIRELERWLELVSTLESQCKWDQFLKACGQKVDTTGRWHNKIIAAIGTDAGTFRWRERYGYVPYPWLERVMAMPDFDPASRQQPSNFSTIGKPLVAALRSAGKSSAWIAHTITAFLTEFNGTRVETHEVARMPPL